MGPSVPEVIGGTTTREMFRFVVPQATQGSSPHATRCQTLTAIRRAATMSAQARSNRALRRRRPKYREDRTCLYKDHARRDREWERPAVGCAEPANLGAVDAGDAVFTHGSTRPGTSPMPRFARSIQCRHQTVTEVSPRPTRGNLADRGHGAHTQGSQHPSHGRMTPPRCEPDYSQSWLSTMIKLTGRGGLEVRLALSAPLRSYAGGPNQLVSSRPLGKIPQAESSAIAIITLRPPSPWCSPAD